MATVRIADVYDLVASDSPILRDGAKYCDYKAARHLHDAAVTAGEKVVLETTHDATFSGQPTNGRLYPQRRVKKGNASWLADYPKPVLLNHKSVSGLFGGEPCDPIGRVNAYRYRTFVNNKEDENLVVEGGTGVTQLVSIITDQDAVDKVMDKRYLTTSVGFVTNALICTVCNSDWAADQRCEHVPNQVYKVENCQDAAKRSIVCYLRAGDIEYQEWSFVNIPASKKASITSHKIVNALLEKGDCLSVGSIPLHFDSLSFGDKKYSLLLPSEKEVIVVGNHKEDKDGWVRSVNEEGSEDDPNEEYMDEEAFAYAHVLKSLIDENILDYTLMEKEDGLSTEDITALIKELEDAKLSTKQRKSLKTGSFCGPKRSFPANDCAHVRAGFRLLSRASVSSETKARIRACLSRKNASMDCGVKPKDMATKTEPEKAPAAPAVDTATVPADSEPKVEEKALVSTECSCDKSLQVKADALKTEVARLLDENASLVREVKDSLAKRLFSIRLAGGNPAAVAASKTEDGVTAEVAKLAGRSIESLKDSLVDDEVWSSGVRPTVERGSVTDPTVPDRSKDSGTAGVEPKQTQSYADRVFNAFHRGEQ